MRYLSEYGDSSPNSTLDLRPGGMDPWSSFLMVMRGPLFLNSVHLIWRNYCDPLFLGLFPVLESCGLPTKIHHFDGLPPIQHAWMMASL